MAQGCHIGVQQDVIKTMLTLEQLLADGYELVEWSGRNQRTLVDSEGFVFAVCAGKPIGDKTWDRTMQQFGDTVARTRDALNLKKGQDRRGPFETIAVGVSYGGGQTCPGNLVHREPGVQQVLDDFLKDPASIRIAHYQSACYALFVPKLFEDTRKTTNELFEHFPDLKRNFPRSVFAAATVNFPPDAFCYLHTDHGNRAVGWCAITAGGNYDYRKGGHLVLPQLKLIIEFPPGSTILIPSATLTHGNTSIGRHESRFSFAQYSSGGLFRYVSYGFRTWPQFKIAESVKAAQVEKERTTRWMSQISLLSRVDDLHVDRQSVGIVRVSS
ncbi:hypothetical protein EIP86_003010 [Pleurotus ostreatoroseus]|nr:hypothetical protein EIP86_003010 [Pleurotus ostreatoroseus]